MITDSILKNRMVSCLLRHFKTRKKLEVTLFDLELISIYQNSYLLLISFVFFPYISVGAKHELVYHTSSDALSPCINNNSLKKAMKFILARQVAQLTLQRNGVK